MNNFFIQFDVFKGKVAGEGMAKPNPFLKQNFGKIDIALKIGADTFMSVLPPPHPDANR